MTEPRAPPVRMIGPSAPNGPAAPDAHGARDRLEHREPGLDAAAVDKDALHRLGDAVAPDLLGAEARHETHDEAAGDRDEDGDDPEGVGVGRDQVTLKRW